ncbi:MAG: hypothetical protein IKM31_02380 [Oscillospiraceae bacterium]|nr:hypothetical protein [Oscillospiraceae bacterium]
MNHRARPFWAAFFLTVSLLATTAALLTVDCRCRMMTSPTEEVPAAFSFDSAADGEGYLRFSWFDAEKEIILRPAGSFRALLRTMPALIPRPFRAAALLPEFSPAEVLADIMRKYLPAKEEQIPGSAPPSFFPENGFAEIYGLRSASKL